MDNNIKWLREEKINRTIANLKSNGMNGYFVENRKELFKKIEEIVSEGSVVSCGGSMTLFESGIIEYLRGGRYKFLDRYEEGLSRGDITKIYKQTFMADAYFVSTNAVTEKGELYNVDGTGNRVAAIMYGPDKVIVICGVNKIVSDLDGAIERNRKFSAPANAKRVGSKAPCTKTGYCMDCTSMDKICTEFTLIKGQANKDRIHVIFLNEDLGY